MNITLIPFNPNPDSLFHKIIKLDTTTIGIYSGENNSNTIHTYTWRQGSSTLTVGNTIPLSDYFIVNYFNTPSGLKRYTEMPGISAEIYSTPNFDELGTVENILTTDIGIKQVIHHEGKNYPVEVNGQGPPNLTTTIYQNINNTIRFHSETSTLYLLNYGGPNYYNNSAGEITPLGNFYFIAGSNQVYSFSTDTLSNINSLRCAADSISIPSGSTVQTVSSSTEGVIVTTVNLLSQAWNRYIIKAINKTC